jgi:HAD superfamily hydrolase (TIGR01662 family)
MAVAGAGNSDCCAAFGGATVVTNVRLSYCLSADPLRLRRGRPVLKQAVVLVGSPGARPDAPLGDQTATTPKSMLHVADRPFLDTLIDEIVRYDAFEEILLLAGHQAERVLARYSAAARGRARLTIALDQEPRGTAGALAHAINRLQNRFLLFNGASFFDFNLLDLVWRADSSLVHMALCADTVGDRSNRVVLENDRVRAFVAPGHGAAGPADAGVYVIDRSIVDGIDRLPASLEQDVLPALAASGTLRGTCYRGYFVDVGIAQDLASAEIALKERLRRPAVFFDRDGVLNHDMGHVFEASKLKWIDGAREAVKAVNDAGYFAFVVSNQSGVARGLYQESDIRSLHRWMADEMALMGAHIDAFEYCPEHPEGKQAATEAKLTGPIEVSDLRPNDHGVGHFMLCMRGVSNDSRTGTYAVFFDDNVYKALRLPVIADGCEKQNYHPAPVEVPDKTVGPKPHAR